MSGQSDLERLQDAEQVGNQYIKLLEVLSDVALCSGAARRCRRLPPLTALVNGTNCGSPGALLAQRLLAALEAAQRVVELLAGGAPQQELEQLCSSFLDDVQVGAGA